MKGVGARNAARLALAVPLAAFRNVTGHWALALFSLVAAFGVWVVVQDVDNPRVEGTAPAEGAGIAVRALNVPDGYVVEDLPSVRVRVEARKTVLATLRPGDFEARVEIRRPDGGQEAAPQQVRVTSRREGVRVLEVEPPSIDVALIPAKTAELPVTLRHTSELPLNLRATDDSPPPDPLTVTIRGKRELVESVASVDLDVSLRDAREGTQVFEGDLAARTRDGNQVQVQLSQARARVTFKIEPVTSQRTLGLTPVIVGSPAPGYIVTNILVDPPGILVTGPKSVIDGLRPLNVERLDVTGARGPVTGTRQIERPPNVITDRQAVFIRVDVQPIDCGGAERTASCEAATLLVAPAIDPPLAAGYSLDGPLTVPVKVYGPIAVVGALKPGDIKATISLTGAGPYPVKATGPAGVRLEPPEPIPLSQIPLRVPVTLP